MISQDLDYTNETSANKDDGWKAKISEYSRQINLDLRV